MVWFTPVAALIALASFAVGCRAESEAVPERSAPQARAQAPAPDSEPQKPERTVAVTFDDLPFVRLHQHGPEAAREMTARLLDELRREQIPAIGFVNEERLERPGETRERTALLEQWLDAGMELGNHTYDHASLWKTPLEEMQHQVLRGERVTRRLLAARGMGPPRYFRHPTLNTGPNQEIKQAFERFLAERGYHVAPVTIDNADVMYALAYDNAAAQRDGALMRRIGEDYVRYMDETFAFFERLSREFLDREPTQVLMLHASRMNADYMDELVAMMRERGYGFVSLEQALKDPAYRLPDEYTGREGMSWLRRWAITQGRPDRGEERPPVPGWVKDVAYP